MRLIVAMQDYLLSQRGIQEFRELQIDAIGLLAIDKTADARICTTELGSLRAAMTDAT